MSIGQKEKEALFSSIKENLAGIVGASGKPEELVRLTTTIVQGTKRLLEGVPESLSASCTTALTSFVICAKSVAQNPRGVDATVIKQLSTTRSEVERNVDSLGKWHFRTCSPLPEDLTQVMEAISRPPQELSRSSPEACSDAEREQKLLWDLQKKRDTLLMKMEPQQLLDHIGNPHDVMVKAVQGLMKGADQLSKHTDGKMPSKDLLLEPMILVVDMVCKLLDLVDSLFVSKYPMRSQVYSFCTALIDNVTAYGHRSKSDNVLSLRNISTQTPALLNASKVMVEQCETRLSSLQTNMDKSMMRSKAMKQMDSMEDNQVKDKKKTTPSAAPASIQEVKPEFQVYCMVCTSVAVDQKTQQPISRGTELDLMIPMASTVRDMKKDLSSRTGLPYDNIQLNQGQDELTDGIIVNPNNPLPYFLFNREEPTEDELKEQRKIDRSRSRVTLDDIDWSNVTACIAVAVFDYDTLGDEKSLAFDEGDIIEIIEKSADGWWEGRSGNKTGTFPASFVKEITSTDEGNKALERARGGSTLIDEESEEPVSIDQHASDTKISLSPKPPTKKKKNIISRGMSNPEFNVDFAKVREIKEKGRGIFNKKKKGSGYANLNVVDEKIEQSNESPIEISPTKSSNPKPLFKPRKSFGSNSGVSKPSRVPGDSMVLEPPTVSHPTAANETNKNKSSPIMIEKKEKKRPPPPKPQPFAKTHPNQAAKLNLLIQAQGEDENEKNDNGTSFKVESKKSNSMEDLLKNLEDFENAEIEDRSGSVLSNQMSTIEYETYNQPQNLEGQPIREVETIKISEYKSDSENDDIDTDNQLDDDSQTDTANDYLEQKPKHNGQEMSSLQVVSTRDEWKPHEWVPSPEPPIRKARKPPSWSFDVKTPPLPKGSSNGGGITKANSFDQSDPESPAVMTGPSKSSASLKKPSPNAPASSLPQSSSGVSMQLQKPVAPPRNKKKGGQSPSIINSTGRRAPTRAPPPVPLSKPKVFPTSKSDIGMHSSSDYSGLQQR